MATEEIPSPDRLHIPERLKVEAKLGALVPFIGAGVSRLGGCPGWEDFANAALRFFLQRGMLDHAQFDQLTRLSARVKLSVAVGLEQQYDEPINFKSILESRDHKKRMRGDKIYSRLAQLACTFVTTNYDRWLDTPPSTPLSPASEDSSSTGATPPRRRNVYFRLNELRASALPTPGTESDTDTVFHIHGSAEDRESMILTTSQYLERYANHQLDGDKVEEENPYVTFLETLFKTKSVLFIGYGLNELEVLEYVIQKGLGTKAKAPRQSGSTESPKHHLVQGFFSHEIALMRSLKDYYRREFNVRLLPFSKDEKGHDALIDVVEYLAKEIPSNRVLHSQRKMELRALL